MLPIISLLYRVAATVPYIPVHSVPYRYFIYFNKEYLHFSHTGTLRYRCGSLIVGMVMSSSPPPPPDDGSSPARGNVEESPLRLLHLIEEFYELNLTVSEKMKAGFLDMARARISAGRKHAFGTRYVPKEIESKLRLEKVDGKLVRQGRIPNAELCAPSKARDGLRRRRVPTHTPSTKTMDRGEVVTYPSTPLFGSLTPPSLKRSGATFSSTIEELIALANLKLRIEHSLADMSRQRKEQTGDDE